MPQLPFIDPAAQLPDDGASLLSAKEDKANKGVANGYAPLDATSKVPSANLPDIDVSGQISTHNSATTSVHGIANTADLATKSYADGAGLKAGVQWTTRHTTSTGNQYVVGSIVYHNGRVYRCLNGNDSIEPVQGGNAYWADLGVGYLLPNENPNILGGSINTSNGLSDGEISGGAGGSINIRGGNASGLAGGNGGSIDLSGMGDAGGDIVGNGGSIISAGWLNGMSGGTLNMSGNVGGNGGSITTTAGGGAPGGYINTSGDSGAGGSIDTRGSGDGWSGGSINTSNNGGSINTYGLGGYQGGYINTSSSVDAAGGYIDTSAKTDEFGVSYGGGYINTSGSGGYINTSGRLVAASAGGYINTSGDVGGNGGYINTSSSGSATGGSIDLRADGTGYGGSIVSTGFDNSANGGTLNMSASIGGSGGSITTTAGPSAPGGSINTSASNASAGGDINTSSSDSPGGYINTSGDISSGGHIDTRGRLQPGGSINTSGSLDGFGGSINTSGGTYDGGSINTSDGGGSIDTRGVGSIQLGVTGTRTTLNGSASVSDKTITLPDATGTIALTSDSRFTDARTPTAHTHGNITNDGKVLVPYGGIISASAVDAFSGAGTYSMIQGSGVGGSIQVASNGAITIASAGTGYVNGLATRAGGSRFNLVTQSTQNASANLPVITTTGGNISAGSFGTTENTFCQGNDARLSNGGCNITLAGTSNTFGINSKWAYGCFANKAPLTPMSGWANSRVRVDGNWKIIGITIHQFLGNSITAPIKFYLGKWNQTTQVYDQMTDQSSNAFEVSGSQASALSIIFSRLSGNNVISLTDGMEIALILELGNGTVMTANTTYIVANLRCVAT